MDTNLAWQITAGLVQFSGATRFRPHLDRGSSLPLQTCVLIAAALKPATRAGLSDSNIAEWCDWIWLPGKQHDPANADELFDMWQRTHILADGDRQ